MRTFGDLPRVLTVAEARRRGISEAAVRHRVDSGSWTPLVRGTVLTRAGGPHRLDWAMAGLLAAGPTAALSGWDAARLVGVGADRPPGTDVLLVTRGGRHRRLGRVVIRPTSRAFTSWLAPPDHDLLPWGQVVDAARAVSDTALATRRADDVRALVTAAVQRGVCSPEQLVVELDSMPRARSASFRRALDDVRDGTRSVAEAEASDRLRAARVAPYELNVPVVTADGVVVAVLDVLWRELRAVVEIDGRAYHWDDENAYERTLARHNRLTRVGFVVEHHSPRAIEARGAAWARGVDTWLRARALSLGVPYRCGRGPVRCGPNGPQPVHLTITSAEWRGLA